MSQTLLPLFITFRLLDLVDILLVAALLYQFYRMIRGTVAINIFIAIFTIYLIWLVVQTLSMKLLSNILGQVIGVGVIALIIVFQPEIRRFLLLIGTRYLSKRFSFKNFLDLDSSELPHVKHKSIVKAVVNMSKTKTGALIVIGRKSALQLYIETGDILNANTTSRLIETIFSKNTPLHDGAMIIIEDKIYAAGCILPVSENMDIPANMGTRHRAGLGMTEHNDSLVLIVSEETGEVAMAEYGKIKQNINVRTLIRKLESEFAR